MSRFQKRSFRLAFVTTILFVALVSAFCAWRWLARGPIRYENFDSIRAGMTKDEVEALLGCPHGDYSTGTVHLKMPMPDGTLVYQPMPWSEMEMDAGGEQPPFDRLEMWHGDRGQVIVAFDTNRKVRDKQFVPGRHLPPDWLHWLEWRFGFDDVRLRSP